MTKNAAYNNKNKLYYSWVRWDIIGIIPEGNHKILDVGCGAGNTLIKLKESHKAQEIYGIELNEEIVQEHIKDINHVFVGDIEQIEPPFPEDFFDYIIFADVFEHLTEPEKVLKKYTKYLNKNGVIIASIPNIKHYSILFDLIVRDKFEYKDAGIMDRTHLRFFTRKEIINMFERVNMRVTTIRSNLSYPVSTVDTHLGHFFSRHRIPGSSFFTIQYIVCAKKIN
jgi:2-polyprenyl-3-methyl-5-hydroxy-6-metoxy-1,4-benzoquinol methylase